MKSSDAKDDATPAWYCVRTQTKREYLASKALGQLEGVETFCPRLRYKKVTRRGKVWWIEAMFPGYTFARFSRQEMERAVVHTQGVLSLLKFGQEAPAIPDRMITDLHHHIQNQLSEDGELLTLNPVINQGDEVEIAHGALQGLTGEVVEILPANERVKVLIDFLGQPQLVDADIFTLLLPNTPLP